MESKTVTAKLQVLIKKGFSGTGISQNLFFSDDFKNYNKATA